MNFDCAQFSDKGPRSENEDTAGLWRTPSGILMAVADGLGGHFGGQFASRLAIDYFLSELRGNPGVELSTLAALIHQRIKEAQAAKPEARQMATTFSAIHVADQLMKLVHCGDTRIV